LLGLGTWFAYRARQHDLQREHGRSIFHGEIMVPGSLQGHDTPLPSMATRCSNCHEASNAAPNAGPATASSYAAPLNRQLLTLPKSRRGGPPTLYNAALMCTLLRTGIDPAHIIVPTIMPRYEISDLQCADLWSYLESR
jgi:hypothetical protein